MVTLDPDATVAQTIATDSSVAEVPQQIATRALARAAALLSWGWLVLAPLVIVLGPTGPHAYEVLLVVLALAGFAALGRVVVERRPSSVAAVNAARIAAAAAAIAAIDVLMPDPGSPANPATSLMGAACLVAGLLLPRRQALTAALLLAIWQCWWNVAVRPGAGLAQYLEVLLTAAGAVVGGLLVAESLYRSARQVSALATRLLAERREEQGQLIRESSLTAARTDLHDTVLTTLSGIGAGWLSSDRGALESDVERDIRLLSDLDEPEAGTTIELVEALRAMSAAVVFQRLEVHVVGRTPCRVPALVGDTFLLATREALVNVVKHADATAATVTVDHRPGTVCVTVRDDGRGFDLAAGRRGLGVAGMTARLAQIGGTTTVRSAPGRGTTVVFERSLPGVSPEAVPPLWSVQGPRRAAIGLLLVAGVSEVLAFLLQASTYPQVWAQLAALAVLVVVDALVVVTLVRQRRLAGWVSGVLIVRIGVVLLLTAATLPGCTAMSYQHFSGGGEFITCIVVTLLRPRREALLALAVCVGSWAALAAPLFAQGQGCAITAVVNVALAAGLVVGAMTLVGALRRHARIAAQVLAAEERLAGARTAQALRAAERRRLLSVVRGIVTDTLAGLADGRLDPADPEVRRICRRDARLLRAFLTQAGDHDELITDLFGRAVALRGSGIDLSVRGNLAPGSVPPERRQALVDVVDASVGAAVARGWSGEGLVTVLRAGDDVLVTVVLRSVPAGLGDVPWPDGGLLERAEVVDGDLWVTCRSALGETADSATASSAAPDVEGAVPWTP